MGLDIGGNTITQASSVLTLNTGGVVRMLSAGGVARPSQPMFAAVGNQAGAWVNFTDAAWNKVPFNTVLQNVGACYDAVNSRFVAPVAGWYFFQANAYIVKNGGSDGYYMHPVFYVNGSAANAAVNTGTYPYRIRGYGENIATYLDSHITQLYALAAGDYVEHYCYAAGGGTTIQYYAAYTRFTGVLLG